MLVNGGIVALGSDTSAANGNQINNDTLGSFATGLYVENSGIVDAGQLASSATPLPTPPSGNAPNPNYGYYGDITGLYSGTPLGSTLHSMGGNSFSGYTSMPSNVDTAVPQAIRDENTGIASFARAGIELSNNYSAVGPQLGRMDVTAQGDTFGSASSLTQIENVIYHDVDNPALGFVDYGQSSQPAPQVVGTPQYSANFNLSAAQGGTANLVSGPQPTGVGEQKSVIRYFQVVFNSFVFLDPNLLTKTTNLGLDLIKVNGPYGAAAGSLIAGNLYSATYDEATGDYTVTYSFIPSAASGYAGTLDYGSLEDGNYTFQFNQAGIQGGGPGGTDLTSSVGGNPYVSTPASFHRLFGDTQGRGEVNNLDTPSDLAQMRQTLGSVIGGTNYLAYLDFGDAGYITGADYTAFLRRYNYVLNANGTVSTIATASSVIPKPLKATYANGVLSLTGTPRGSGQLQALEILAVAGTNKYQVMDNATVSASGVTGGTSFGTFNNVRQINLNLISFTENVIIDLNGGTLPGSIDLNLGHGNANPSASPALQVSIVGSVTGSGAPGSMVGGSVYVSGGSGQEAVLIGGLPPNDSISPLNTAVKIGGNVSFIGSSQTGFEGNTLTVQAGSTVNGSVFASQVSTVTVGDYGFAGGFVGGNVVVSDGNSATAADVAILGRVGGMVSVNGTTGGAVGGDLFAISNNGTGIPGTVGGSVTTNLGSGKNSVFMDAGTVVGHGFTMIGGSGGNTAQLSGAIGGSLFLYEGNGGMW